MNPNSVGIIGVLAILMVILSMLFLIMPMNTVQNEKKPDKLEQIMARGTIVIATDPESSPFSELIPGSNRNVSSRCHPSQYTRNQFTGFDVAVGCEIADRLGVEPCFVTPAWTRIVSGDWADSWDISVGSMTITYERMNDLYFTQPYNSAPAYVFVRDDQKRYQRPEDLNGKRIGVCAGCAQEAYLKGMLHVPGYNVSYRIKNAIPVAYNYEAIAFADLSSNSLNKLDAIISDAPIGMQAVRSGMPVRPIHDPVYFSYFSAALDKKSLSDPISLLERVSAIISMMHTDGILHEKAQQYLGDDYTYEAAMFDIKSLHQLPTDL